MDDRLRRLDERILRFNLLLSQGILLVSAMAGSLWLHGLSGTVRLLGLPHGAQFLYVIGVIVLVVGSSIGMEHFLPARWQDDGEISRKIFQGLSIWSTFWLCLFVGLSEEWLFRGVLQPLLGNGWTSVLFAIVHYRYLRKPLLMLSVLLTSLLLGWLFSFTGGLLAPVAAHAMIDFLLALYLRLVNPNERSG
ncbi:CPBP family intramembrane metalloprotease [Brevibacillus sp. SYP-B805]|uniref:CPBP family intramembrane glutamic endopeptidase n=1 Tax=Brevibacillus sp. SYP-B805 TaxID=1578199 RepID=UPI0013EAE6AA|nr:CPBP family intramembrane glutamic endopeptidase [Brevibacillus sp. SYP-B805]NGQ94612.1 CPBP family intramembrane metalloprotease [Brevibacillus sp. SYP-B805]